MWRTDSDGLLNDQAKRGAHFETPFKKKKVTNDENKN